jgi:acyl carrier protein
MMHLEGEVRDLLCRLKIREADRLDGTISLYDSGLVDSLHLIALLSAVEDEFAITIRGSEVMPENFDTIAGLTAFVASKRSHS